MTSLALILVVVFVLLLVMNVPIAVAIALASFAAILAEGSDPSIVVASKMANGVNSAALLGLSENPVVILLTINLLLLFVGTFMDMTPAVLIFTPIFLPVAISLGMHPVHFGIVLIANLCIGLCTPPVGTCLFIGCGVGKTTIARVTKTMLPFFGAMAAALMVITYVPATSLWLPVQTKQIKQEEVEKSHFMRGEKDAPAEEEEVEDEVAR